MRRGGPEGQAWKGGGVGEHQPSAPPLSAQTPPQVTAWSPGPDAVPTGSRKPHNWAPETLGRHPAVPDVMPEGGGEGRVRHGPSAREQHVHVEPTTATPGNGARNKQGARSFPQTLSRWAFRKGSLEEAALFKLNLDVRVHFGGGLEEVESSGPFHVGMSVIRLSPEELLGFDWFATMTSISEGSP